MINYGDLMHRIVLKTNSEEEIHAFVEELFSLDKKEFFIFLKSMALLLVNLQKEIKELKSQLSQQTGGSSGLSN